MTLRRAFLTAVAVLVVALPSAGIATSRLGESPHGKPDQCGACHTTPTGGPTKPIVATCRGCHPDADMHPVGMAPHDVHVADGFPLEDGLVTCATCHTEPAHHPGAAKPVSTPPWFRGGDGPKKLDFCYRCHTPAKMERTDPHIGDAAATGCTACHATTPTKGAPPSEAKLRLAPAETCSTCHPGEVHAGAAEHVGKVAKVAPDAAMKLPLDGDRVACFTCHDVHTASHDAGPPKTGIAARIASARPPEPASDRPSLLALPASDDQLCRACHGTGP